MYSKKIRTCNWTWRLLNDERQSRAYKFQVPYPIPVFAEWYDSSQGHDDTSWNTRSMCFW